MLGSPSILKVNGDLFSSYNFHGLELHLVLEAGFVEDDKAIAKMAGFMPLQYP